MNNLKSRRLLGTLVAAAGVLAFPAVAASAEPTIDPTDPALVPGPVESSDPGTQWTCQTTGGEVQCTGDLSSSWESEPGPDDWCSQPLFSVDGQFERRQTRYYSFDPTTGSYLETKRLIHLDTSDSLVSGPGLTVSRGRRDRPADDVDQHLRHPR